MRTLCIKYLYYYAMITFFLVPALTRFLLTTEKRPFSFVKEAKQYLLSWHELHNQPHKGCIHLNHFKQYHCSAQAI